MMTKSFNEIFLPPDASWALFNFARSLREINMSLGNPTEATSR